LALELAEQAATAALDGRIEQARQAFAKTGQARRAQGQARGAAGLWAMRRGAGVFHA